MTAKFCQFFHGTGRDDRKGVGTGHQDPARSQGRTAQGEVWKIFPWLSGSKLFLAAYLWGIGLKLTKENEVQVNSQFVVVAIRNNDLKWFKI